MSMPNIQCRHCGKYQMDERDSSICDLWERGVQAKEIAARLKISTDTVARTTRRFFMPQLGAINGRLSRTRKLRVE